jgi:hypothetical protein
MTGSYIPVNWWGKEFTPKGGVLVLVFTIIYAPMHEFGHWLAYWIFGIPAEFGIMYVPLIAFFVRPIIVPSFHVRMFSAFFGGGFVFLVVGAISIKSRPSLLMAIFSLAAGITEFVFHFIAVTCALNFPVFVASHLALYTALHIVPMIVVFLFGLPEFRRWPKGMN